LADETKQPRLGQLWLIAREGEARRDLVADVALPVRTAHLYSYAVPNELAQRVRPGVLLRVPYGRRGRLVEAWCVSVAEHEWDHARKVIAEVRSPEPLLNEVLVKLGLWISDYYACPPGMTFTAMVPATLRKPRLRKVSYVRAAARTSEKALTEKQQTLVDAVRAGELRRDELLARTGVSRAVLQRLCRQGVLESFVRQEAVEGSARADRTTAARAETPAAVAPEDSFELTPGQAAALEAVCAAACTSPGFQVFLLFGVPGSGKTEVYVRAIREVVRTGRQAILLVPEIALATQVVERLARRFERVAVVHSRLSARVRARNLRAIADGSIDVVIGTRSAVFAPCPRLGLIVVDEEQETSFKSLSAPFFHARDVAIKRGHVEQIPVTMGSATPSLESWHNAQVSAHFRLLRLPERVPGARLPRVRLVSTGAPDPDHPAEVLSPDLVTRLQETFDDGQQAILLHNRRGYAVYLRCTTCGLMVRCPRCGTHMVYHHGYPRSRRAEVASSGNLAGVAAAGGAGDVAPVVKCHRCGTRSEAPQRCLDDTCNGRLQRTGLAIQRLQEELHRLLPQARLLRLDSDTMRTREDYVTALRRFEAHEADILLGTQMVAKGLDFPEVCLVGFIDADAALWLPDFRAAEHVFQLLVQVVGRAGRRAGDSIALVQSSDVTTAAIRHAVRMDYEGFAKAELAHRQRLFQPPFSRMLRCVCTDGRPGRARSEAERLSKGLRAVAGRIHGDIRVDDAEPCVVPRLRGRFRFQVIVRAPRDGSLQRLLHQAADEKALAPRVQRFAIDVDPLDSF
jgi:primosomal protein N' (replication factor Y)